MEQLEETWLLCHFVSSVEELDVENEALGVKVSASFDKLVQGLRLVHDLEMVRDGEDLHGQGLVEMLEEGMVYELGGMEQQMAVVNAQMEAA